MSLDYIGSFPAKVSIHCGVVATSTALLQQIEALAGIAASFAITFAGCLPLGLSANYRNC